MQDINHINEPSERGLETSTVVLKWNYEVCTDNSPSAFNRLSKEIQKSGAGRVILDMSKCEYLSIAGLRCLMEWQTDLAAAGIVLRVRGLSPMLELMIRLSRLEWIIEGNEQEC